MNRQRILLKCSFCFLRCRAGLWNLPSKKLLSNADSTIILGLHFEYQALNWKCLHRLSDTVTYFHGAIWAQRTDTSLTISPPTLQNLTVKNEQEAEAQEEFPGQI